MHNFLGFNSRSRMRFSSKIAPALNVSDMKPNVLYCFDESSTVSRSDRFVISTET